MFILYYYSDIANEFIIQARALIFNDLQEEASDLLSNGYTIKINYEEMDVEQYDE